ncbi:MAG: serine/threonine-protein kinase [Gemmataceae bacterium]
MSGARTTTDRLVDLLVLWEEERRRGRPLTPEELCPDDPALRQALRDRIAERERYGALWSSRGATVNDAPLPPPRSPPKVGGREVLGELGRGGMGVVYKARQTRLNRLVALKMVLAQAAGGPAETSRFHQEAEATARLQHPNIVQIYEVGEHEGCPYFVLEFVGGGTLAEQLHGTPLPVRRAVELAAALARGVQHAHEHGVLHRDLKPANVLLAPDGTPKITDFGLAKRLDIDRRQTLKGAILGTPSYMAPEQAEGLSDELTPSTDVYALGAILYECLTGRPPFLGDSVLETLDQVRALDPLAPSSLRPGLPRDLETVCLKCLAKDPAGRYPSAESLADDLRRFLDGEPVRARSLSLREKAARAIRFIGVPGHLRPWGLAMLLGCPVPVLIHLTLFLLCRGRPAYPLIAVTVGVVAACVVTPLLFWPAWEPLRRVPRAYRRFVASLTIARCAGWLLIPALVATTRPGHDLAEFFLVFPLWIFLDGNYYCLMGTEAGVAYLVALVHYAAALLVALALPWSPLALGVLMSGQMLLDGLILRSLQER